jgi:hypothetical protein
MELGHDPLSANPATARTALYPGLNICAIVPDCSIELSPARPFVEQTPPAERRRLRKTELLLDFLLTQKTFLHLHALWFPVVTLRQTT